MMKKVWLVLLAVVLVFGLVVSCGGGDKGEEILKTGFTSDLSGLNVKLVKNQYAEDKDDSRGLQGKFENKALMQGNQVNEGDEFTLKLKFTLDKALDYDLEIGFVDTTVGESEGYWRTLTWDKDDPDDNMYLIDKAELLADTEIEKEIKLTAVKSATGKTPAANSLVFESRDVWTKDPVTITFVSFIFIAGDGGEGEPVAPSAPPVGSGGSKVVEVSFNQTWAGIDLLDSVFHFAEGDTIAANGKIIAAEAGSGFVFNDQPGGWGVPLFQKTGITAGTEWEFETDLNATMITNINDPKSSAPKGIRVGGNSVSTADTLVVVFEQIKITRDGTVLLDLAEHLETLDLGEESVGVVLPGSKGFQNAGTITVEVKEKE